MTIRQKMLHGMKWVFLERMGLQAITFFLFMVTAKLVGPEEYGLFNICLVFFSFAYAVITGLVDGVISHKVEDRERLSSLFWLVTGIGLLFGAATYAFSDVAAYVMKDERLSPLIKWCSVLPVLVAIPSVSTILVQARMDFKIFTIRSLLSTLIGGGLGLTMAYQGYGAYSLIAQQILMQIVIVAIIWPSAKWRPHFYFRFSSLAPVLSHGTRMVSSNLLGFLGSQMPRLVIGYFLGPVQVGFYSFTQRLISSLLDVFVYAFSTVFFPALAKIKDDINDMKKLIAQVFFMSSLIVFPALAGLGATADQYIPLFFGEKWIEAAPLVGIYALISVFYTMKSQIRDTLRSQNLLGAYLNIQAIDSFLTFLMFLVLSSWGLETTLWGLAVETILILPIYIQTASKRIGFSLWPASKEALGPAIASALMVGLVFLLPQEETARAGNLIFSIIIGSGAYVGLELCLERKKTIAMFQQTMRLFKKNIETA